MRSKFNIVFLTILVAMFITVFVAENVSAGDRKLVKIDGSSTVFPITEAVAEEFQMQNRNILVTVGISGTGGGFQKFSRGEIDISDASRPIKAKEITMCEESGTEYIELPVAYDGLAVMVHPQNDWVDFFTPAELKKIWEPEAQKTIMRWNQIRPEWPDKEIHLFGPGVDSGTFDYFTKAITGKEGSSRGDFTASEDDNVLVQGIATDKYSFGFFGLAYYEYNKDKLKLIAIDDGKDDNGKGPIFPTLETINNGTYRPLSRPIFIYVNKKSLEKPEVNSFVQFYLTNAPELTAEVGYIPLPDKVYALTFKKFKSRKTGTVFGGTGSKIGLSLEDLLGM